MCNQPPFCIFSQFALPFFSPESNSNCSWTRVEIINDTKAVSNFAGVENDCTLDYIVGIEGSNVFFWKTYTRTKSRNPSAALFRAATTYRLVDNMP